LPNSSANDCNYNGIGTGEPEDREVEEILEEDNMGVGADKNYKPSL
jgi:hypothetical protein